MGGFKLIAIRPISKEYCKVLKPGQVYQFYNDYHFTYDADGTVKNIEHHPTMPENLYSIRRHSGENDLNVNISAIVGKNGCGKSSVLELLFAFCFVLAKKKGLIDLEYIESESFSGKENIEALINSLEIEIFYEYEGELRKIYYDSNNIYERKIVNQKWARDKFEWERFFYCIAVNYSLYGLNSRYSSWLYHLFHKNDGYQTPIVINPFRQEGIIDVNSEYHLAQSRVLANIVSFGNTNNKILDGKEINEINFTLDPYSYNQIGVHPLFAITKEFYDNHNIQAIDFFNQVAFSIAGFKLNSEEVEYFHRISKDEFVDFNRAYLFEKAPKIVTNKRIRYYFVKYVIRKIFKICLIYPEYKDLFVVNLELIKDSKPPVPQLKDIGKLVKKLKADKSHLTLKLRQALFILKSDFFSQSTFKVQNSIENPKHFSFSTKISYKEYRKIVNSCFETNDKYAKEIIEIIPGALVKPTIILKDSHFTELSSGEQQFLHTLHTVLYHLYNLNSVFESKNNEPANKKKYKNVNIVLDEIELYFHPEFQRNFIKELLNGIKQLNIPYIENINILFASHSPFILSDIPIQNVLRLKKGISEKYEPEHQTFAANIHELLADSFFLENELIGEFGRTQIQDIIDHFNYNEQLPNSEINRQPDKRWSLQEAKMVIELIGEPFLKEQLFNLLYIKEPEEYNKDRRIKELEEELNKLRNA